LFHLVVYRTYVIFYVFNKILLESWLLHSKIQHLFFFAFKFSFFLIILKFEENKFLLRNSTLGMGLQLWCSTELEMLMRMLFFCSTWTVEEVAVALQCCCCAVPKLLMRLLFCEVPELLMRLLLPCHIRTFDEVAVVMR